MGSIDNLNSSIHALLVGQSFIGEFVSTIMHAEIMVSIHTNENYQLNIHWSSDGRTIESTETWTQTQDLVNLFIVNPSRRYYRIQLNNIGGNQSYFNLSSILKSSITYKPVSSVNVLTLPSIPAGVNHIGSVNVDDGIITTRGIEPNTFKFYATPETNTQSIYSDGAQGTNINGGWQFINTAINKINWYCYQNSVDNPATAKKLKNIDFMYMVMYLPANLTAIEPTFTFYSLPSATNNAASWYKNRYVYSDYTVKTIAAGYRLYFIGTDNPTVRPDILNRVQLPFDLVGSTSNLIAGAEELLSLGSIQTSSNTTAGRFNFIFNEYGINFKPASFEPVVIPIINGLLQVKIADTGDIVPTSTTNGLTNAELRASRVAVSIVSQSSYFFQTGVNNIGYVVSPIVGVLLKFLSVVSSYEAPLYFYIYNRNTLATNTDQANFKFLITANAPLNIPLNYQFTVGIVVRCTTDKDGTTNPPNNSVFTNITLGFGL